MRRLVVLLSIVVAVAGASVEARGQSADRTTVLGRLLGDPAQSAAVRALRATLPPGDRPLDYLRFASGEFPPPAPLMKYLQSIADRLLQQASALQLKPVILVDDCPAFRDEALPNGQLVFCLETLRRLSSESELAFLVGHELGHLLLNHAAADQRFAEEKRERSRSGMSWGIMGMSIASSQNEKDEAQRILLQEREADELGLDLATAAGFNPVGVLAFFDLMHKSNLQRTSWQQRKIAEAKSDVGRAMRQDAQTGSAITLTVALGALAGMAVDSTFDDRRHDSPAERKESAANYIRSFHSAHTSRDVGQLKWKAASSELGAVGLLFGQMLKSQLAFLRVVVAQLDQQAAREVRAATYAASLKMLDDVLKGPLKYHNRTRARAAIVCTLLERAGCARDYYAAMRGRREAGLLVHVNLASTYLDGRASAEAAAVLAEGIETAKRNFPTAEPPPARMAIAFMLLGDNARRRHYEQQCRQELNRNANTAGYARSQMMRDRRMISDGDCDAERMFAREYVSKAQSQQAAAVLFFTDNMLDPF